jgi:hypothetical protein
MYDIQRSWDRKADGLKQKNQREKRWKKEIYAPAMLAHSISFDTE